MALSRFNLNKSKNYMKAKNLVLLTVSLFTSTLINAWSQPVPADTTPNPQATIAFYSPKNIQTFLVSNRTDKTLVFTLQEIEVKIGSEWKSYSDSSAARLGEPLSFRYSNPDSVLLWLTPHETGYGFLETKQQLSLPKGVVWRAKFTVQEQLTGQERDEAAAKHPVSPANFQGTKFVYVSPTAIKDEKIIYGYAAPIQPVYYFGPASVIYSYAVQPL
jgi:hypothetical protein